MSSREIAELTGKQHRNVIRDIRNMMASLGNDSELSHLKEEKDARGYTACFHLNRDLTDCLLTGYSAKARMAVIKRWRELEQQAVVSLPDFTNPAVAARAWADEVEEKLRAQAALEHAKPAVEFVERYVTADTGNKGFRQVAKLLKANERELRSFLKDSGIMYQLGGEWMPYQQHIDAERFVVKTGVAENEHAYNSAKFTPKGVEWLAGQWGQYKMKKQLEAENNKNKLELV